MTPQDQEFLHDPDNGMYGDCQRAVIASLLNLPRDEVPHFNGIAKGDPARFWQELQGFLSLRNFAYLTLPASVLPTSGNSGAAFYGTTIPVYHEIAGPSPRDPNVYHAVVGLNGKIVHDPHPSRAGLAGDPAEWEYSYLVHVS